MNVRDNPATAAANIGAASTPHCCCGPVLAPPSLSVLRLLPARLLWVRTAHARSPPAERRSAMIYMNECSSGLICWKPRTSEQSGSLGHLPCRSTTRHHHSREWHVVSHHCYEPVAAFGGVRTADWPADQQGRDLQLPRLLRQLPSPPVCYEVDIMRSGKQRVGRQPTRGRASHQLYRVPFRLHAQVFANSAHKLACCTGAAAYLAQTLPHPVGTDVTHGPRDATQWVGGSLFLETCLELGTPPLLCLWGDT
jgi:hypothetical protein